MLLHKLDILAIEDAVYAFLADGPPPLAVLAPERSVVIDSLSKRLSLGLTVGFIIAPPAIAEVVSASPRSGAWIVSRFALEVRARWMSDGTARHLGQIQAS